MILTLGCTEFNVASIGEDKASGEVAVDTAEPDPGQPGAAVSVDSVDAGIACIEYGTQIEVMSVGDAPLSVTDIQVVGEGWSVTHAPLPVTVDPGGQMPIDLSSTGGTATLVVRSNDPDVPVYEIPLHVTPDRPPTVTFIAPSGGEILSPGASTVFTAIVEDDVDPPEALSLKWASDVDGLLSTVSAHSDGHAEFVWEDLYRSSGEHVVSLSARDSCERANTASVGFCQNEGYTEESIDLVSWNFEGSAFWDSDNEWVELTGPHNTQAGTAFQTTSSVMSDAINIEFSFFLSGGSGADGMSLTALDVDRMTSFVGGTGGGIGYYGLPGWSVEIDTYYNSSHSDPTTADHLSVHLDGNVNDPQAWAALPEMEDGAWHLASVAVVGNHITVQIDGVPYIDQVVDGLSPFPAYVGFTASTGALNNYHLIDSLEVEGFICED